MPTGYTADIVNGKITKFEDFAKLCIRNFGAALHMRDESMDIKYKPREVGTSYYDENIIEDLKRLEALNSKTDDELLSKTLLSMRENREYHIDRAQKDTKIGERLLVFMQKARAWVPPTEEHLNFKNFMIEQLQTTLNHDGNPDYHIEAIKNIDNDLKNGIDPKELRRSEIADINDSISRSQERIWNEVNNVYTSNKWVKDLINTINN